MFLGWVYITHQQAKIDKQLPGWYSKYPPGLFEKLRPNYKGRAHNELNFYWDWNALIEVIIKIKEDHKKGVIGMCGLGTSFKISALHTSLGRLNKNSVIEIIDDILTDYFKKNEKEF